MRRRRRRPMFELPMPKRPYRDSAIMNAVLSACLVLVAYLTGGRIERALLFAVGFFLVATAWSWWRFRARLEEEREQ